MSKVGEKRPHDDEMDEIGEELLAEDVCSVIEPAPKRMKTPEGTPKTPAAKARIISSSSDDDVSLPAEGYEASELSGDDAGEEGDSPYKQPPTTPGRSSTQEDKLSTLQQLEEDTEAYMEFIHKFLTEDNHRPKGVKDALSDVADMLKDNTEKHRKENFDVVMYVIKKLLDVFVYQNGYALLKKYRRNLDNKADTKAKAQTKEIKQFWQNEKVRHSNTKDELKKAKKEIQELKAELEMCKEEKVTAYTPNTSYEKLKKKQYNTKMRLQHQVAEFERLRHFAVGVRGYDMTGFTSIEFADWMKGQKN